VTPQTVTVWLRALDVPRGTKGTRQRHRDWAPETLNDEARQLAEAVVRSPERVAKIRAAKLGKPRPRHVIEAMRKANMGRPHSPEHRAKLREAWRRRPDRPLPNGRPWTAAELAAMGKMFDRELATRYGRCMQTVARKRKKMGIPAFTRRNRFTGRARCTPACPAAERGRRHRLQSASQQAD